MSAVAEIVPSLVPAPLVNTTASPPAVSRLAEASRADSVSVTAEPAVTVPAETATVDCAGEAAPGPTVIVGAMEVTGEPPIVALVVRAVPAVVAVNDAVYVPFPLSVVAEIVPSLVPVPFVNTTVSPPPVSALLAASRAVSVSVAVVPDTTFADETVTVDRASVAAPGVTVIVGGVDVTAPALTVAPMLRAEPAVLAVNVAV